MTNTTAMTPEMSALKSRLETTWASGDYGVFAKYLEKGALEFFDRLNIPSGTRLLDVACGAGQLTLPAARKGIQVTGLDLAANLVQQARTKALERPAFRRSTSKSSEVGCRLEHYWAHQEWRRRW